MWGDQPKGEATKGLLIVDTGAAIALLTKKWMDAHGLPMREKAAKYISGTNGTAVKIIGTTSMTLLLVPTLETDVSNITICSGNSYQGLLRCDLLCGYNKALSAVTISLPGPD